MTATVILRPATSDDSALLFGWRNDASAYRFYRTATPVMPDEHARWLAAVLRDPDRALAVITADGGNAVGQVRLDRHGDAAEVTIAIAAEHRGHGYGRAALAAAIILCGERFPDARTMTAEIAVDNASSHALFLSAGFRETGRRERFVMYVRPVRMIVAVLQARVSSTRLPGKVLKPILGKPMLARQIERIRRSTRIDHLVVATSTDASDDAILVLCERLGVACSRGSLTDVLDRVYRAAVPYAPTHVVRLTGDCPLTDPAVIDEVIDAALRGAFDYTTNAKPYTYPDGLDVEVVTFAALTDAWREGTLPSQREHVTPFVSKQPERYHLGYLRSPVDLARHRWTVDEPEDFAFVTAVYAALYPQNHVFTTADILAFLIAHPDLACLNAHHERNAGRNAALAADAKVRAASAAPVPWDCTIAGRAIGGAHPPYVIAEIGINHNGRLDLALEMIARVAAAGADAAKFQLVDAARDYAPGTASYDLFRRVALPPGSWERIARAAADAHIPAFASFAMPEDVATAQRLGFPAIKISSGNLTNLPLLRAAAMSGLPIILSTAMSTLEEVRWAVRACEQVGAQQLAILHCTAQYPLPLADANLRALVTLAATFPYPIGYSDHSVGATCAVAAVALGARIIEKHVTLDRALPGPDHHFSATMEEFADLVRAIRATDAALGTGVKVPTAAEVPLRSQYRRTLVAARDLPAGTVVTAELITAKRATQQGLDAREYDVVLGRTLSRMVVKDAPIVSDALAPA